jgi:hypothetical protein
LTFKLFVIKTNIRNINPSDTSKLIICAAALIDPRKAYLELLDHPLSRRLYIPMEESANNIIRLNKGEKGTCIFQGNKNHTSKLIVRARMGDNK